MRNWNALIMRSLLTACVMITISLKSFAQEPLIRPTDSQTIEETLENHAEFLEEEYDYTDLFSELEYFLLNPLPVNRAGFDEIRQLFFLNEIQINNLLKYIANHGKVVSLYELAYIDGFDRELIAMLSPFITLSDADVSRRITPAHALKFGRNQLFVRYQRLLETQRGFLPIEDSVLQQNPNQRYLGSPYRLYTRYGFNYRNRLRWGVTAEKDPGEEFFRGSQNQGFDFYSAFVWYKGDKWLREIVVGDYHLQFGQGLTLWTTFSFGKSADVSSLRKISRGIRPNTSVNENQFLRGSAITVGHKNFSFTAFGSHKNIDATIVLTDSLTGEVLQVSALQQTGLHRTPRELENRRALGETLYGGRASYSGKRYQIGATWYKMSFDAELLPSPRLYNRYYFRGSENHAAGADMLYMFRNGQAFGEISRSASGGMAMLAGGSYYPSTRLLLTGVYRKYDKDYQNIYNSPLAEASNAAGEEGLLIGMMLLVSPKLTFSGYADHFRFNWLRFRVDAPSAGKEYLGEFIYLLSRHSEIRLRYRYKQREQNLSGDGNMPLLFSNEKQNVRLHFQYRPLREIVLRNRIEWVINTPEGSNSRHGYMMYQDVQWRPANLPWTVSARYALFDTDTFDERIYAYENDVLYAFSVPAYYYKGSRVYLLARYQASRKLDFWFRISQTWFSGETTLGSGLDEISGNTRSELKLQLRYRF